MGKNASEVRQDIEQIRYEMGGTLDQIGDHVSPKRIYERRTQRVREGIRSVRDTVMGPAESAKSGAQSAVHGVGDVASGAAQRVGETPQMITASTRGNPLVAGFITFGVGLLLGSIPPATEQERDAMRSVAPQLEPIRDKAIESAQRIGEDVQDAATDAAKHVKRDAQSAMDDVKGQAQGAAHQVAEDAAGRA